MKNIKRLLHEFIGKYSIFFFGIVILVVVIIGTFAFYFVEPRDLFHSFYFTTITMATVGYGDMAPITYGGKILAIIYGFMGAPLFIGLTGILFQSRFHKLIQHNIHAYHKEVKETEALALQNQAAIKKEQKEIQKIAEEL